MVVFVLSGLWHGANWTFIVWGALHGFYIIAGKYKKYIGVKYFKDIQISLPRIFRMISVFLLVSFGWIFFRARNISDAFKIIRQCTSGLNWRHPGLTTGIISRSNFSILVISLLILIICEVLVFRYNGYRRFLQLSSSLRMVCYILLCMTIVTFGMFNNHKFIYFQF